MNIYRNFLNKEDFKKIEYIIMSNSMPWFFSDGVNKKNNKDFQFTFNFINEGSVINCSPDMINLLNPFKSKLNIKKFDKVKANLLLKDDKIKEHGMHIDNALKKGKTGIFYLNTCNGYTKFEDGTKIKSEKNKYVEFDCNIKHTGSSCTDKKRRIVINFNYEYI
jgi:hypothetical protein